MVVLPLISWLIFVYPWQRLFDYLPDPLGLSTVQLIALWLLPVLSFYVWSVTRTAHSAVLGYFSVNWLGLCLMFAIVSAITEICRLLFSPADETLATMLISGGLCLSLYAIYCATRITTKYHTLHSEKLQHTYKAVQLSDLHLGSRSLKFLTRAIEKTNSLNPDIVFITGDLIDMSQVRPESLDVLNLLQAPAYFVTGNHDRYVGTENHLVAIQKAGIEILANRSTKHQELQIIGIGDGNNRNQVRKTLPSISADYSLFTILLYHKPENFDFVKQNNIDLMLSGHTHGGQIFPFSLVVKNQFPYNKGLYKNGDSTLYVSQGTGTWGPVMRLGSANEITVFELKPIKG